jgi:hypothetical protein
LRAERRRGHGVASDRSTELQDRLELDAAVQCVAEIVLAGANHHLARRGAIGDQPGAAGGDFYRALDRALLSDIYRRLDEIETRKIG